MKVRLLILLAAVLLAIPFAAKTKHTPHGTWELVWKEDFRGRALDAKTWKRIPRFPNPPEWNKYMSLDERLLSLRRGKLILWGVTNDYLPADTAHFLTGGIYSKGLKTFHRGRIEIRLKMDDASGAWPAAWLLPEEGGWPDGGEIDIMERLNGDPFAYQTVHSAFTVNARKAKPKGNVPKSGFQGPIRSGRFNVYGVEMYEDSLCFFINDAYVGTYRRQPELGPEQYPFDRPMYLLIDMQLGGYWVGKVRPEELPYRYQIDYVKYYRKKD
ncbi:MAG: glycoside hydrolase family 16 protein [Bacteroidaceae bacterium]|nr:glycoside hydrolase family 16 protein [Bacteroidaceae bacterium]